MLCRCNGSPLPMPNFSLNIFPCAVKIQRLSRPVNIFDMSYITITLLLVSHTVDGAYFYHSVKWLSCTNSQRVDIHFCPNIFHNRGKRYSKNLGPNPLSSCVEVYAIKISWFVMSDSPSNICSSFWEPCIDKDVSNQNPDSSWSKKILYCGLSFCRFLQEGERSEE
jgi:hypothetical protein